MLVAAAGLGFGGEGGNLPSKELQVECRVWAGCFQELPLLSCK